MNTNSNVFEFLVSEFFEFDLDMNKSGNEYTPAEGVLVARVLSREANRMRSVLSTVSKSWWTERAHEKLGHTFQVGDREETGEVYLNMLRQYQEACISAGFDTHLEIKGPTVSSTALFVTMPTTVQSDTRAVATQYLQLLEKAKAQKKQTKKQAS